MVTVVGSLRDERLLLLEQGPLPVFEGVDLVLKIQYKIVYQNWIFDVNWIEGSQKQRVPEGTLEVLKFSLRGLYILDLIRNGCKSCSDTHGFDSFFLVPQNRECAEASIYRRAYSLAE